MIYRQLQIVGFLLLALFQGCHGQKQRTLYGTTGKISEASVLYIINPTTGRGTRINKITYQSQALTVNGMAFDTTDRQFGGQMYIHTGPYSPNYPNSLFSLDVTNGVATLISETMLPQVGQLAIDQFGTRYGWQFGGLNQRIDDLVKFRQNGMGAELFGDSGITTVGNIGIDFDRKDATSLYMVNFSGIFPGEIITISTANGAGAAVKHIDPAAFTCSGGKFDPDSFGTTLFGFGGQYWCVENDVDGGINLNTRLQVIDTATGLVNKTLISNMDNLCTVAWTHVSTAAPSSMPSRRPSAKPSRKPSAKPSRMPSKRPSASPSVSNAPSAELPDGFYSPSFYYWLISFMIGILILGGAGAAMTGGT
jgi:hypothetical protein